MKLLHFSTSGQIHVKYCPGNSSRNFKKTVFGKGLEIMICPSVVSSEIFISKSNERKSILY